MQSILSTGFGNKFLKLLVDYLVYVCYDVLTKQEVAILEMQERIKAIRKYVKMTQSEFAISLGLGPYSSAAWEKKDAQIPTESMQLLICKTFGINKHWLETGEGDMLDGKSEDEILVEQAIRKAGDSPAIRALLEAWLKLPDNGRVALERFAADFVAGWQAQQDARKEAETAARVRENIQSEESAASNQ